MDRLAIFDIDFTLTKKETLVEFYKFVIRKKPSLLRHMPRSLYAGILYIFKVYDLRKAKEKFISFIDTVEEKELESIIKEFYEKVLSKILYEDSMEMIRKLKKDGCKIILISASSEFYLKEFYNIKEVDKIIGTRYEFASNGTKGRIIGLNCKGDEKVIRLKEYIKQEKLQIDFKESFMFSDSLSDAPLFKLVGHPYLINYKNKNQEFEVLKWK
ncbi:MAG: HAD-IB family hydrolase [Clostridiaceae bacterium]|nr:HAD-IB family hydrolase [Clostridiaceae bacterium]